MQTKTKKIILGLILTATLLGVHSTEGFGSFEVQAQSQVGQPTTTANQAVQQATSPSPAPPTSTDTQAQKELNTIIATLITIEKAFLALTIPLNIIIGKLLSNDWVYLDGDAYKAIETLWILMRNIVNIVFACLLLIIAIAQIAGAVSGSESKTFALKQALPGFIFGLIFVNFSLLACKVILDVGNLATTAAFSMVNEVGPNLIAGGNDPNTERILINKSFCWPSQKALQQINTTCKSQSGQALADCLDAWAKDMDPKSELRTCMGEKVYVAFGQEKVAALYNSGKISPESWAGPQPPKFDGDFAMAWSAEGPKSTAGILFGARNVMMVYTNSIFRMPEILTLYNKKTNLTVGTGTGILMTTLLTLIFGGMIILINVALVMALGIRMVLIWMILIFSPLMALEFVSDGKFVKGFLSKAKFDKGLLNGLVGLAFMPAIAGIVLSLGFIIFHVLNKIIYRTTSFTPEGTQTFSIPPFNIEISGSIMPMFSTLGEFIIACILLIILWQALFQMMQTNKYMDGAINKISKLGETIAGSAKLIPFIPMPGGTKKDEKGNVVKEPNRMISWGGLNRGIQEGQDWYRRKEQAHERNEIDSTVFDKFLPPATMDQKQIAKLDENWRKLQKGSHEEDIFAMPLNILIKNEGKIEDPTEASRIYSNLKEFANEKNSGLSEKDTVVTNYLSALSAWKANPTSEPLQINLRSAMRQLYLKTTNTGMRAAMEKEENGNFTKERSGEGFKKPTEPTPPATGQPSTDAKLTEKHEGATPGEGATYNITATSTTMPASLQNLTITHVPQVKKENLDRTLKQYDQLIASKATGPTLTAAETNLQSALSDVLSHNANPVIPTELASLDPRKRSNLAKQLLAAAKAEPPAASH